jgi:hypothetical protein
MAHPQGLPAAARGILRGGGDLQRYDNSGGSAPELWMWVWATAGNGRKTLQIQYLTAEKISATMVEETRAVA